MLILLLLYSQMKYIIKNNFVASGLPKFLDLAPPMIAGHHSKRRGLQLPDEKHTSAHTCRKGIANSMLGLPLL